MRASVVLFSGLAVVLIGPAGRTGGYEPARPKPPGPVASKGAAEVSDDPLPAGAVARMGSPRFRHAAISDFRFVSDGKSILTSGSDRVVRTWDAETGRATRTITVQAKHPGRCRLSADGKLAAVCDNERISVCDAETGKVLADFAGPKSPPAVLLTFSPDGKLLAVAGQDSRIKVWDWKAGTARDLPLPVRDNGQDSTFHAHFSPDGKYFAGSGHFQLPLCVYDTATWEEVRRVNCDAGASTFTPDGKRLIVSSLRNDKGDREAVLRVLEMPTGTELAKYALGHENVYYSLTVSPDGRMLGCGASDRSCLFDLTTGKVLHFLSDRPWALRFSPDSKTFAATANGTHLRFWDVATGKERHEQPGNFGETLAKAVSPNGRLLAAADWMDQAVHVWDTATGRYVRRLPFKEGSRYARDLAFSPDGATLSAGQYYGQVQAWETATGKEVLSRQLGDLGGQNRPSYYSTRVSSDGRWAATIHQDSYLRKTELTIWDVPTGKPLRQWTYPGEYYGRAWSPDSGTLVLTPDAGVTIIDVESGEQRGRITGVLRDSTPPVMSPDGRLVAVRIEGEKGKPAPIGVYESATCKRVITAAVGWGRYAIARDNQTLFIADDTHVRAWDLSTGKETASRRLPLGVTGLVPLRERKVFTPLTDGTGLVWDLAPARSDRTGAATRQASEVWWADLASREPARPYEVIWQLNNIPEKVVVGLLSEHLRPEAAPDPAKLQQLIADLNSNTFRVREQAEKELQNLGHAAVPALRKALDQKPGPEVAGRIEKLLSRKRDAADRPETLRRLRAMQVLEQAGTKEARAVLTELAKGLPLAPETKEAQAALARME